MTVIKKIAIALVLLVCACGKSWAQADKTVTYEELYDAPYEINKLFMSFQPLYSELFVANVNAGFGVEATYYLKDQFDFTVHGRLPYFNRFDMNRFLAETNSEETVNNEGVAVEPSNLVDPVSFYYVEGGASYHFIDREEDTETKVVLYRSSYAKGDKLASRVLDHIKVPSKMRRVYSARLGVISYASTVDLDRIVEDQGVQVTNSNGENLKDNYPKYDAFTNVMVTGFYTGVSMSTIKNFAIKPDRTYGVLSNDQIFDMYFDFLIMPFSTVDDLELRVGEDLIEDYDASKVQTSFLGFRFGISGKFNREFGWGYGAEFGFRPGVRTKGFYAVAKLSFPVFSTNLDHQVEAFGK